MNSIVIASIVICLAAMGWSIVLLQRVRNWRIVILTVVIGLMTLLLILKAFQTILFPTYLSDLIRLGISMLLFLSVFFFERILTECKRAEEALRKAHDELEIRVKERTAELSKANEVLKQEIRERRRIENALRKSEEKFRNLVEQTNDCVWEIDKPV